MTPDQEYHLFLTDRPAWLAYVAPRLAGQLPVLGDAHLGEVWATLPRDYQRAVWRALDATTRQRLQALRTHEGEAA